MKSGLTLPEVPPVSDSETALAGVTEARRAKCVLILVSLVMSLGVMAVTCRTQWSQWERRMWFGTWLLVP